MNMLSLRSWGMGLLCGVVVLAGCAGGGSEPAGSGSDAKPAEVVEKTGPPPGSVGSTAADFTLENVAGGTLSLRAEGTAPQPTLLVLWATWCGACRNEIPAVEKFYRERSGKGVRVISVSVDQGGKNVAEFVLKTGMTYPVALDRDGSVAQAYGVTGIPAVFVVDRAGVIRYQGHSVHDAEKVIDGLSSGGAEEGPAGTPETETGSGTKTEEG